MAAVKRKNEADFLAAVMREFAQWLRLEPRLFGPFAPSDRCFPSSDQESCGGKTAGRESLPAPARRRKG
jgi:hypothetical protein